MPNILERIIDWFFDTFGKRETEKTYTGHNNYNERRKWVLKIFNKEFCRYVDDEQRDMYGVSPLRKVISMWRQLKLINYKRVSNDDIARDLKKQIADGFITEIGKPLKCQYCGSKDLKRGKEYSSEIGVEEYEEVCGDCGNVVGTWSYGSWQL